MIIREVTANELLEQFISVETADLTAGAIVVRNVGRVLSQQITDDLVDGIVTFFRQGSKYIAQNLAHALLVVSGNRKLDGTICHEIDLLCELMSIIAPIRFCVKGFSVNFLLKFYRRDTSSFSFSAVSTLETTVSESVSVKVRSSARSSRENARLFLPSGMPTPR